MEPQGLWEQAERLRGAADEAARLAQNVYLSFLLLGTYIAVIIGSTTDVQLLKVSPVTLPLLNVPLPIVGFYVVVPWLLLLFYFNLLLHLTFLAQRLHRLNAVLAAFSDEAPRAEQRLRLFPFPFSALLIGRPARWSLRVLLGLMVWTTVLVLPLVLLLWAQVRFLPSHDTFITWTHRIAILVDLALLWLFGPLILIPESGGASPARLFPLWREEQRQWAVQRTARTRLRRWRTGLLCLTLVTVVFALGIAVLPEEAIEVRMVSHWLFDAPGAPFHRNLQLQGQVLVAGEPSAEVLAALRSDNETRRAQGLDKIAGLILTNQDLRGADLRDTLFAKADMRGANLKGTRLGGALVFAGDLSEFFISDGGHCIDAAQKSEDSMTCQTQLQGADLKEAQLQGAHLGGVQLQGANLWAAQLQGADLKEAQLQGASLGGVQLQGANLKGAQLQDANLWAAQLQGANLWDARLEGADLKGAQLQGASLVSAQLQGASLGAAQLQGADLEGARLEGADLKGAQLQGASLVRAQLQGADLEGAQLQGASLEGASIGSANFTGANLTLGNLRPLSLLPLDENMFKELEQRLTGVIRDEKTRTDVLERLKAAVEQPPYLTPAHAEQVLCSDVNLLPSCLTDEQIRDYAQARATFLGTLGCLDPMIATRVFDTTTGQSSPSEMRLAFAKRFIVIKEKACPGWAALSEDKKNKLRTLAAEEPAAR
jgi:uncharacterized protein YjbI with pentapeptide repeats